MRNNAEDAHVKQSEGGTEEEGILVEDAEDAEYTVAHRG